MGWNNYLCLPAYLSLVYHRIHLYQEKVIPIELLLVALSYSYDYDTLLFKPYSLPKRCEPNHIPTSQHNLAPHDRFEHRMKFYHELQKKQEELRAFYQIPITSAEKPFYHFDQFDAIDS